MRETRAEGIPSETGTLWPPLPHTQPPGSSLKSLATMVMRRRVSGPLPIRFTSLMGAVTLPPSTSQPFLT